jgi:hypothetical protein
MNILNISYRGFDRGTMAYLRKEKEIVEIDYPIGQVWAAIAKAIVSLEWKTDEIDEAHYKVKTKTKQNFMAYPSTLTLNALKMSENTTRITVSAETPVTTITGIIDFGKTRERIDSFLLALTKQLKSENTSSDEKLKE